MYVLVLHHLDGEERAGCFAYLSSWCLVMVERLFLAVPQGCLRFVIVVFPDHTHLLFFICLISFAPVFSLCTVESLSLLYLLFIS